MKPQYIFVHHTAVSQEKNPDQWKATESYHKAKGWGTGGYNAEVSKDGSIHTFREDGEQTAAQYVAKSNNVFPKNKNLNNGSALSICLDGYFDDGHDEQGPTIEQCASLYGWIKEKMGKYNIPRENVFPHRLVSPKSCPGFVIPEDIIGYLESRLSLGRIPDWMAESIEKAKKIGITKWDNPWEEVTPLLLEQILEKLGLRLKPRGTISKGEFIHILDKAGLLT